jgi:predicted DCC family thiol-disulfide oxidoreductase YuxK
MSNKLPILIYDEDCPLCLRFKQALSLMDTKNYINFVSLKDDSVFLNFPQLKREECSEKIHLLTEEEKILIGPEVIEYLIRYYPVVNKLTWLIETGSGKKAINLFHQKVEEMKELLKKKDECQECPRKN